MNTRAISMRPIGAALVVLLGFSACDAPLDPLVEASGVVFLRSDGSEAARYVHPAQVSGRLQVGVGRTATYQLRVLDQDGDLLGLGGFSGFSVRNPVIVISLAGDASIRGADELVLQGNRAANTTLRLQLYHGDHFEFEVRDLPLSIQ